MDKKIDNDTIDSLITSFERALYKDDDGIEFWYARDLQVLLQYTLWQNFEKVLSKAKTACLNSKQQAENHFIDVNKMVDIGSNTKRQIEDVKLTRYACYLIAQNADSRKKPVAFAQTYFAIQTRRQELSDKEAVKALSEDEKRLLTRNEIKHHLKNLAKTAKEAGVGTTGNRRQDNIEFAQFQNAGYKGLYDGLDAKTIHSHKGLKKSQHILDHMGSEELAANLFRVTQTESKLKREKIQSKRNANKTHYDVG